MKKASAICAVLAFGVEGVKISNKIDSPSQKVVDLLKKVKDEVTREGDVEEVQFTRYADFCHKTESDRTYSIEKATENIKKLTALIESLDSSSQQLDAEVAKAEETIASLEAQITESNENRAKENAAYETEAKDMDSAISAMYKATVELEQAKGNLKGNVKALPQLSSVASQVLDTMSHVSISKLSEEQVKMLNEMTTNKPEVGKAADYKYKSGDVVQMLKDLRMTFKQNRQELDMAEMQAKNSHELKVQGLTNEKQLKTQESSEKSLQSAKQKERKGSAEVEKADETTAKEADESYLSDLKTDCEGKAAQHKQRSGVRSGELEALAKAIDFLKKGTDASLLALKKKSFIQFSTLAKKGLQLLEAAVKKHKDAYLTALALKIRTSNPDQGGTVDLIKDLIAQLKEQGEAAEKRHNDCEQEIEEVSASSGSLIRKHETLISTDEQKTAERNEKLQKAADLSKEISQLKNTLQEATNLRTKERAENEISLAKAKEGSEACKFALETLSQFYDSVALIQTNEKTKTKKEKDTPGAPKFTIEEGDYKGREGGIIAEVQKLKDEMDASVSDTEEYESSAESDFKTLQEETDTSVEAKTTEMEDSKANADSLQVEIVKIKDETADTSEAAALAQKELDHVKAKCDDGAQSFEQQKANREQEIKDLESVISAIG